MQYSIQNLGLTVPGQQRPQGYFTSVGTSMGLGKRHEPLDGIDVAFPGPGEHEVGKNAAENNAPKYGFGTSKRKDPRRNNWPGPGDTNVPSYTTAGRETKLAQQILEAKELAKERKKLTAEGTDSLGPTSYKPKYPSSAPVFSFGARFGARVGNKEHLRPTKVDGPGPGAYNMPKQYQAGKKTLDLIKDTTFGTAPRGFSDLPKANPSPAHYRPVHFTEASHAFSIPRAPNPVEMQQKKLLQSSPGPLEYDLKALTMAENKKPVTMGGVNVCDIPHKDNGFPGPANYNQIQKQSIPGFVIAENRAKVNKTEDKKNHVGPATYTPYNMNNKTTNTLNYKNNPKITSIGHSERQDMVQKMKSPAPGRYEYDDGFNKKNAKFHMGVKTQSFMGKNLDQPGPGEYETDVIPIHHSNVSHFIGTSVRSDLGVGKAYMYPGPQEYEVQIDPAMDPRIRIAGTFGTQKKDTVVKKTFAPGPGSYDLPQSTGLMPQYLRTEENKRAKKAQDDALRARLEI